MDEPRPYFVSQIKFKDRKGPFFTAQKYFIMYDRLRSLEEILIIADKQLAKAANESAESQKTARIWKNYHLLSWKELVLAYSLDKEAYTKEDIFFFQMFNMASNFSREAFFPFPDLSNYE